MSTTVKVISCVLLTLRLKKSITQGTVPCVNQNQISFTALVIVSVANAVLLTICQLYDKINLVMKYAKTSRKRSNTQIYHVMLRGINQQQIFEDYEDYRSRFPCEDDR